MIRWEQHREGVSRGYADMPRGARPIEVNGRPVQGICEACGWPITDGMNCKEYADGVMTHRKCRKKAKR